MICKWEESMSLNSAFIMKPHKTLCYISRIYNCTASLEHFSEATIYECIYIPRFCVVRIFQMEDLHLLLKFCETAN